VPATSGDTEFYARNFERSAGELDAAVRAKAFGEDDAERVDPPYLDGLEAHGEHVEVLKLRVR
jgi:hypothetical protein